MRHSRSAAAVALLLGLAAGPASAQTAAPAPRTDLGSKPGTLSDKLSGTDGVIRPTGDIDPAMHKPTPQAGTMPVVKPGQINPATPK